MRILRVFGLMVCVGIALSCDLLNDPVIDPCEGDLNLEVTVDSEVRFSWKEACKPTDLEVLLNGDDFVWAISGEITSPVTYGEPLPEVETVSGPDPLSEGEEYTVYLLVAEREGLRFAAEETFVR